MSAADTASAFLIARLFEVLQNISVQVQHKQEILVPVVLKVRDFVLYSFIVHGKQESFSLIYQFAFAVLAIILVKVSFVYSREYLMSSVQQKILMRFRTEMFDRIVCLPVKYFDENKTGHIMSRITNDVNNLEQALYLIVEFVQNIVYALIFATALFYTSWQLTLVSVFIFTLSGAISRRFGDRIRSYSKDLSNTLADISAFLQERISAIRIVKSFTREKKESAQFKQKVETNYHFSMKIVRVIALLSPTNELFNTIATSLLVVFCGYLFIIGSMTIETMIFFLIIVTSLAKPIKSLGEGAARIQKTLVSARFIFDVLDLVPESQSEENVPLIVKGNVCFEDVSFSYTTDLQAISHISFKVAAGETIALVGPSGSGKSTLVNLIPRFYDIVHGKILIDDIDSKNMNLQSLRNQIAIVPQDVVLFSGNVRENIRYGRLTATDDEVFEAARAANAHTFIERLEHGYDTEVGERGLQLSGGQRQRIAIARAVLRNPKILLLDEATSALDTESELIVQEALERLMKGRTSFVIAHRLSTITHCDRIFVLDAGTIVEMGTHEELLQRESGLYKRLHSLQFADSQPE
ncbi:MAG TPA: ABC transporter ATP-binding protein [Bacteroidota bacterium]|nr:ABC transporter ATP-binding protein [Bacteroidota bacterium]